MRKALKILHTLASSGLIGGLAVYMALLATMPQSLPETSPAAYADLRETIAAITSYIIAPSLFIALISGLLAMVVHTPFLDKGWVWVKALMATLMFKGVLIVVVAEARHAANLARDIANGADPAILDAVIYKEWFGVGGVMALSIANVVVAIWRPRIMRESPRAATG